MPYNVEQAFKDGVPEEEIVNYLAKSRNYNLKWGRDNGYSNREIIDYLSSQKGAEAKPASKEVIPKEVVAKAPSLVPPAEAEMMGRPTPFKPTLDYPFFPKSLVPFIAGERKPEEMVSPPGMVKPQPAPAEVTHETPAKPVTEEPSIFAPAMETVKNLATVYGPVEAAANLASQMAGLPIVGAAQLAGLPFGKSKEFGEVAAKATIYEPKTEAGKQLTKAAAYPFELLDIAGEKAADVTREITGSPVAATAVGTAIKATPLLLGLKGIKGSLKSMGKSVLDSGWYRSLTVKERGLVTQSLEDMISKGYSEGEVLRRWNNPSWREEALRRRNKGEEYPPFAEAGKPEPTGPRITPPGVAPEGPEPLGSTIPGLGTPPVPSPAPLALPPPGVPIGEAPGIRALEAKAVEGPEPIGTIIPMAPPPIASQPKPIEASAPMTPIPQMVGMGQEMPVEKLPIEGPPASSVEADTLVKVRALQENTDRLIQEGGYIVAKQQPKSPKGEASLLKRDYKPMLWDEATGQLQPNVLGVWVKEPAKPAGEAISTTPEPLIAPEEAKLEAPLPPGLKKAEAAKPKEGIIAEIARKDMEEAAKLPPEEFPIMEATKPLAGEEVSKEAMPVSEEGVKQPWEMTRKEFVDSSMDPNNPEGTLDKKTARSLHKFEVQDALSKGKPVPPEVLADYPDLQPTATQAVPPTAQHLELMPEEYPEIDKVAVMQDGKVYTDHTHPEIVIANNLDPEKAISGYTTKKTGEFVPAEKIKGAPTPSIAPTEKPDFHAQVNATEYDKRGPVTAYIVDGPYIRKNIDPEFTNFAQHWDKPYVPENEVWLDKENVPNEYPYTLENALTQRREMASGKSYNEALKRGDAVEKRERVRANPPKKGDEKLNPQLIEDAKKELLGTIGKDKIPVWLVAGDMIRETDPDFVEGGNDGAYPWMPKNTIIIDDDISPEERPAIIVHEGTERDRIINKGMKYPEAHKLSSQDEHEYREDPAKFEASKKYAAVKLEPAPAEAQVGNWEKGGSRPFAFDPNSTENEGRFRLLPPDSIKKDSYFRRESTTKGVSYLKGKDKITGREVTQAIRFDKSVMSEDKAVQWWEENKGRFPFASEELEPTPVEAKAEVTPIAPTLPPGVVTAEPLPTKKPTPAGAKGNAPLTGKYSNEGEEAREYPGRVAERTFGRDLRRFAKELQKDLEWEEDPKHKLSSVNIAPVGGDGTILMWKPNSEFGLYVSVPVQRMEDDSLRIGKGVSKDILWRWTTKKDPWTGLENQYAKKGVAPKELADLVRSQDAQVTGGEVEKVPTPSPEVPPRPLVNPKASVLKQDEQLREQQAWDKKYGKAEKVVPEPKEPVTGAEITPEGEHWGKFTPNEYGYQTREVPGLKKGYFIAQQSPSRFDIVESKGGSTRAIVVEQTDGKWQFQPEAAVVGKDLNQFMPTSRNYATPQEAILAFNRYKELIDKPEAAKLSEYMEYGGLKNVHYNAVRNAINRGEEPLGAEDYPGLKRIAKPSPIIPPGTVSPLEQAPPGGWTEADKVPTPPGMAKPEEKPPNVVLGKPPITGNRWFINDQTGKVELYFDKADFDKLSNDLRRDIRAYFLWAPSKKAWVSKARSARNLYQPKRIAGLLEKEGVFKKMVPLETYERIEAKVQEEIPTKIREAMDKAAQDAWVGNLMKERMIKAAINKVEPNPAEVERIFELYKNEVMGIPDAKVQTTRNAFREKLLKDGWVDGTINANPITFKVMKDDEGFYLRTESEGKMIHYPDHFDDKGDVISQAVEIAWPSPKEPNIDWDRVMQIKDLAQGEGKQSLINALLRAEHDDFESALVQMEKAEKELYNKQPALSEALRDTIDKGTQPEKLAAELKEQRAFEKTPPDVDYYTPEGWPHAWDRLQKEGWGLTKPAKGLVAPTIMAPDGETYSSLASEMDAKNPSSAAPIILNRGLRERWLQRIAERERQALVNKALDISPEENIVEEGKEAISGESRRDENILERPVDIRPSGMALGTPPEVGGKTVPGKPEQAPGAVVHEGETGVAEPAGERKEGAEVRPGRRRSVRRSDQPTVRKPTEKAAPGRIPTESERLAVEPADIGPNNRNNRIEPTDILVPTGKISRIKANVNAIKLAKQLEKENRNPTPKERKILQQFTGWGGLGVEAFEQDLNVSYDSSKNGKLEGRYRYFDSGEQEAYRNWYNRIGKDLHPDLGGLMTPEEWAEARSSILNAFYTSRDVIQSGLWPIAQRLGLKGGTIIEPSAGIGHILGLIPEKIADKAHIIAVEKDPLSGLILKKLYPQANVQIMGYEDVKGIHHNMADLVISNFPFGDIPVFDASNKDYSGWHIHNYFFARSVDAAKPGGLIIGITSHYSLDALDPKVRSYLAKKADLVGAIRLPSTAFEKNAGTSVTTDIVVLRKKDSTPFLDAQPFTNLKSVQAGVDKDGKPKAAWVNEYFADHPDMVLGEHSLEGSMYGGKEEYTLKPISHEITKPLSDALKNFPKNIAGEGSIKPPPTWEYAEKGMKQGLVIEQEGNILRNEGGILKPWRSGSSKQYPVAKQYIKVRDAANELIHLEMSPEATEEEIAAVRKEMSRVYDEFVKKHGFLSAKANKWLAEDAEYPLALSLEHEEWKESEKVMDGVKQKVRDKIYLKAPMFTERANFPFIEPTHADSMEDAIKISMTYRNKVDAPYVTSLLGETDPEQVKKDLVLKGLAFMNPDSGLMETPDLYLSGNVRDKLAKAREAEKDNPLYQKNVEALTKVQPAPLTIDQIYFRIGSTWLPPDAIEAFVEDIMKVKTRAEFKQLPDQSRWTLSLEGDYYRYRDLPAEVTNVWGVERADALQLINDSLNLEHTTIYDVWEDDNRNEHRTLNKEATDSARAMQARIQQEFQKWLKNNETWAPEVAEVYNREKNNSVLRTHAVPDIKYYPGASHAAELYPHQKRAVARAVQESVLLDHAVGTGKTYIAATWAMEARRLSTARKPVIVVQNATTHQYARVFRELYPAGNVLMPTKKDFEKSNRKNFVAQVSTGNYDAVVMPHSMFDMIRVSPEKEAAFLQSQLAAYNKLIGDMTAAGEDKRRIRQVEREKEKREVRIRSLLETGREENVVYFEDLNVDALFVDEAHRYKRSDFFTKMRQVKGIDRGAAGRSSRLLLKVQDILAKTSGKNVILATGTPISNTIAELWTMLRYVRPDLLDAYGVTDFDSFASTFGNTVINTEETPTGDWKQEERFVRYVNGPELLTMARQGTDVVLAEDVDVKRPTIKTGGPIDLKLERSPELAEFIKWIKATRDEWNALDGRHKMESSHVPLVLFGLAKKAAIDLRLVDYRNFPDLPNSKANRAVEEIFTRWESQKGIRGVQLAFCDSFQSSDKKFNLFKDIKDKLVKKGIPAKEIAIIHDYDKEEQREELFENVNNGIVRVLMGTTEKLGIGVNVQERATTAHMIDVPYRPMDFEQRMGRLWRPGNPNDDIEILVYGVRNTLDSTMYQRLQIKQQFINQFNRGKITDRSFDDPFDENQATFESMMAAFGNPKVREKFGLESNIRDLVSLRESHNAERGRAREQIRWNKNDVEGKQGEKDFFKPIISDVKKSFPEGVMKAADTEVKAGKLASKEEVVEHLTKLAENADKKMRDLIKTIPRDEKNKDWMETEKVSEILGTAEDRARWSPPIDMTLNGLPVRVRVAVPYESESPREAEGGWRTVRGKEIITFKGPEFNYTIMPELLLRPEVKSNWNKISLFQANVNTPQGVFNSISSKIASIIEQPEEIQKGIEKLLRNNKSLEPLLTKEFPEEEQLEEKRTRLAKVEQELEQAQNVDIGKKGDEAAEAERSRLMDKFSDLTARVYATHVDDEASEQPQVIDTVKGEVTPDERPAKERYFTSMGQGGAIQWTEVKGTPVLIPGYEDYDFFAHKLVEGGKGGEWVVSEGRTGVRISTSVKKSAVAADAKEYLDSFGKGGLDEAIQRNLERIGESSPRYGQKKVKKIAKTEGKEKDPRKKIPPIVAAIPFVLPAFMGRGEDKKRVYPLRPETPSYLPPGLGR